MKLGLVLGAGGLVGVAHHVGVLRALERTGGLPPDRADLYVGTSAGSAVAAYVRSGWTTEDLLGKVGDLGRAAPVLSARDPADVARRALGSSYVLARSCLRVRVPVILGRAAPLFGRLFPAGMMSTSDGRRILRDDLADAWPARDLWLPAFDILSSRRVVLGRDVAPRLPLARAVEASCAIPGFYRPVGAHGAVLVDGGVYSLNNLDLAVSAGCDAVICVSPIAVDRSRGASHLVRVARAIPTRSLARQAAAARRRGVDVLLLSASGDEARAHGLNLMRSRGLPAVAAAAYESTSRFLDASQAARELLGGISRRRLSLNRRLR